MELSKRGHEVDILTSGGLRGSEALPKISRLGNLLVRRFKPIMALGEFGSFWPGVAPKLLSAKYDIVHSHSFRHPHCDISALTSRAVGSRSVLTGHSPFHPNGVRTPLARGLTPIYDELFAPITLRAFDKIITLTDAEKKSMVNLGAPGDRVTVIPNGVEDDNFETSSTDSFVSKFGLEGKQFVLYLGRLNRTKGIEYLLRAFADISSEVPDCCLVIAGPAVSLDEATYLENLDSLARKLGISSRVIFTGRLSEEEKLAALEACTVFALPSLYEPFGIVLLEAAAHSKPIVSAASAGPSSIINPGVNGLLVRPGDSNELGDAILRLLQDPSLSQMLGRKGRAMAGGYRWSNIADKVEGVYDRLLARP